VAEGKQREEKVEKVEKEAVHLTGEINFVTKVSTQFPLVFLIKVWL
jgi:hypothetical protein